MFIFLIYFFLSFILKDSQVFTTGKCPNNLIFQTCGSNCPKTCENYNHRLGCDRSCALNVCQCTGGLVLHNNKCILPSQCPNNSGK
ncbi:Trypsin Inhibitor-like, cysteine rich domain-containing protein [Strongyloides ratti]|uniref:Trypsin Inhibitor-like, cysteine rich domain-containing protein n=1 Tax=Strongyloides ratti TaxID=34506 RepID=A0A090KW53_STRRB|nr:Trypsin Inhibitor-like, cysteine rich domain-containing protein [Strongyloides ratti]CEF61695.1 Trypsin Inhibitor-like, cysteine rich domain-containing protein [Strongyloides ratti]